MFCIRDGIMGRMTSHRKMAAAAALGAAHAASAGVILKTYVGPANGQWNVANNWSPIGVPNNGGGFIYDALIDGDRDASAVTLAGGFTINLLGITVGDSLTITNGSTLGMAGGTLSNFGTLVLGSINATTDLRVDSGSLIIGGPGLTLATNTQNNRIYTTSSASRITIADDHTLAGSFQLGVNQTRLTNDGVIDANLSNGVTVDLTDGAGINFNTGTMRASAGGVMMIGGTTLDNTGGTIEADSGSFVSLSNAHIIGGLINDVDGAGAGGIRTTSAAVLESVTIAGGYTGLNGTTTVGRETIATQAPLSLASINATTDFRVDTATFLLGGSGGITCSNTQNNRIYTSSSAARITVAPESSIAGSFQLGANQTRLTNQGVINASSSNGSTIDLTDGAGINFNSGLLLATNGATLTIGGTTLDNSGGVIEAGPDSFVNLPSAHIIGGTLLDADGPSGAGSIRTTGASVLESVTVQGGYVGLNGTLTILRGGIDLQAPLFVSGSNSSTDLRIDTTPLTLFGPGGVVGSNTQNNRIYGVTSATRLIVSPQSSISGSFQLGVNQTLLTNEGVINASSSNGATIDLTDGVGINFNTGTLRASSGSTLTIGGTTLDNSNGVIEADAGSFVNLPSAYIIGGTLRDVDGPGAGGVRTTGASALENVTIQGGYFGLNGTTTALRGTIDLQSPLFLSSINASTDLRFDTAPFTISGAGGVACSNTQNNRIFASNSSFLLTIAEDSLLRGSFQLGVNQTALVNNGSILADASSGITIDPTDGPGFVNSGLLHLTAGNVSLATGAFDNSGTVMIDAGRTLSRTGVYSQSAGETSVNGSLNASGGIALAGGTLEGNGSVTSPVTNSGGAVAPGTSAGVLAFTSGYTQQSGGTLSIEIGGTTVGSGYDRLAITGNAALAGTLTVARINGFTPAPTDVFTILTCTGTRSGTFSAVTSCDNVNVTYTANAVLVQFLGVSGIPGDVNNDGLVNGADLALVLGNWGPCSESCCTGDLDGNGLVNGADLAIVLGNWSP